MPSMRIRLMPVTPENWRPGLEVSEGQRRFVAAPMAILARAYAHRGCRSRAFLITAGDLPVGLALYYDCPELKCYVFSELLIDRRYQRRGYGEAAARQILRRMSRDGRYDRVALCYIDGNDAARRLYEKLGFAHTGERDGDEILMELRLR